jgi:hypothetical protein
MPNGKPLSSASGTAESASSAIAFRRTDYCSSNVAAPDLDTAGRKAKVLEGLSNAIQSIASLPKTQRVLLERTAEEKAYFLARLDKPAVTSKSTQAEMKRLCNHFNKFRPLYNEYQIASVLSREILAYRPTATAR